ncbi:hypothetical protein [Actinomadura xylanilytica]|uniref:hypothetical protein n=1 Tax=Actinomadura xylanilytica TaxID=887459 RepID=UPI00255AACD7|nr:hypothetical protein [Actinomadura xylanilytica]MDL4775338.1 hypothetical protein [Actinomadura xylanilytica]
MPVPREMNPPGNSPDPWGGLRQIFPEGEIFVVTDDAELGAHTAGLGLATALLGEVAELPDGASVVLLLRNSLVSRDIRRMFRRFGVLLVPIASFDPALDVARYTFDLVRHTDYERACEWNRYWARNIAGQPGPLVFTGHGTGLECAFGDDISADAWMNTRIDVGKWISVASYCEFSLTAPSTRDWRGTFDLNGTVVASGLLVAQDARAREPGAARVRRARRLRAEMVARGPMTLRLREGVLASVEAGGVDFTDALSEVTNPDYELHTLELGIGTNMSLLPRVDWTFNSQLNEGAGPVHLGFGEGITGAHMDFIVAECEHRFEGDGVVQQSHAQPV